MPITLSNTDGTGNFIISNTNNEGKLDLILEIQGSSPVSSVTPTPSLTPSLTPSVTPSLTPSVTRTATPSLTPSVTPSLTPSVTPSLTVTPSPSPSTATGVTFSRTFTNGQSAGTTIENAWTTFRQSLTGTYTQFVWSSTNGSSITVTDAVKVQQIANALRTATTGTSFSVTIGANSWRVIHGCSVTTPTPANAIEFTSLTGCSCSSGYTIRPFIRNANWGGTNQAACNAPTQTITITFS